MSRSVPFLSIPSIGQSHGTWALVNPKGNRFNALWDELKVTSKTPKKRVCYIYIYRLEDIFLKHFWIITHQNSGPLIMNRFNRNLEMITSWVESSSGWNFETNKHFPPVKAGVQKKRPNPTTTHDSIRKTLKITYHRFSHWNFIPPQKNGVIWWDLQSLRIYRFLAGANSMKCQEQVPGDIHFDACILGTHKCCLLELNMYPCNIHQTCFWWFLGK